jgi:hypothetical protein
VYLAMIAIVLEVLLIQGGATFTNLALVYSLSLHGLVDVTGDGACTSQIN